jgi:hypothetical protein
MLVVRGDTLFQAGSAEPVAGNVETLEPITYSRDDSTITSAGADEIYVALRGDGQPQDLKNSEKDAPVPVVQGPIDAPAWLPDSTSRVAFVTSRNGRNVTGICEQTDQQTLLPEGELADRPWLTWWP